MKIISQGAEAVLYKDKENIIKKRIAKSYRIPVIDASLRKKRTRREAKILEKLEQFNFPAPKLLETDSQSTIQMSFIKGPLVKEVFDTQYQKLSKEIGESVAKLHNHKIIHGDLTTSNMIVSKKVHFIDFGLSFTSQRIEDKAVDLHLFLQALESKHHKVYKKATPLFINTYKKHAKDAKDILERLEVVKSRGRNKNK